MRPTDYIASLFKPSGGPGGESAAYDFDPIGSYFYNCPAEEGVFQIVDAETTADLDLNAVFEKIDRTTSRVGQQYLYARLRPRPRCFSRRFIRRCCCSSWRSTRSTCIFITATKSTSPSTHRP